MNNSKEFIRKIPNAGKIFMYNGLPYMKIVPVKALFHSTMIHEVIARGDFFAVALLTGTFTVIPKGADDMAQDGFLF